jgi:hypothetical protein
MDRELLMFILEGVLGVAMLFFGIILSGMRDSVRSVSESVKSVSLDLKVLNDAVLGKYITRDDSDAKWKDQRTLDHELRAMITGCLIELAKVSGKPYDYQGKEAPR